MMMSSSDDIGIKDNNINNSRNAAKERKGRSGESVGTAAAQTGIASVGC